MKKGKPMPPRLSPQQMGFQGKATIAPNILPGVKPDDLFEITCNKCNSPNFHPVHTLKAASRFQSVNGLPTLVQFPLGFACDHCNAVNPFDVSDLGEVKKEEKGGDLGISVSEDIKTKDKPG